MSDIVARLKTPPFGTETSERNLMTAAAAEIERLREALVQADQFITNGIEFGFIRMPNADTPDPAHETPGIIRAALAGVSEYSPPKPLAAPIAKPSASD
jgi:hypothetical protein